MLRSITTTTGPRRGLSLLPPRTAAHTTTRLASTSNNSAPSTQQQQQQQQQKFKRRVYIGCFAAIMIVGTITGTSLRGDYDTYKQQTKLHEASIDERIAMLESRRAALVDMKIPLELKIATLRARMAENAKDDGNEQ